MRIRILLFAVLAVMMAFTACVKEKIVYVEKGEETEIMDDIELQPGEGVIEFSLSDAISRAARPFENSDAANNINRIAFKFYRFNTATPDEDVTISEVSGIEVSGIEGPSSSNGVTVSGNIVQIPDNLLGQITSLKLRLSGLTACTEFHIVAYGYHCGESEDELEAEYIEDMIWKYTPPELNEVPQNHIDEEIFAGHVQTVVNAFGLFEEGTVKLTLTRQVAGLMACLNCVPAYVQDDNKDNIKVGKITIGTYLPLEGIKFPADLLDDKNYNGIVSTSNSNFQFVPLLTFDMEKASNYSSGLKPGDYYTFASNILYADEMKASFSLSESPESKTGVLFGSCFLCPFNNGSHHKAFADNGYATLNIIYYDVNDNEIKRVHLKTSNYSGDDDKALNSDAYQYDILCNQFYSIGTVEEPMNINPKSGYDTYTVRIDNDWTYVHDITSDIFQKN